MREGKLFHSFAFLYSILLSLSPDSSYNQTKRKRLLLMRLIVISVAVINRIVRISAERERESKINVIWDIWLNNLHVYIVKSLKQLRFICIEFCITTNPI